MDTMVTLPGGCLEVVFISQGVRGWSQPITWSSNWTRNSTKYYTHILLKKSYVDVPSHHVMTTRGPPIGRTLVPWQWWMFSNNNFRLYHENKIRQYYFVSHTSLYYVGMLGIKPSITWKCPLTSVLPAAELCSVWRTINSLHNLIN